MASQLFVDLYDCDKDVINNMDRIKSIAKESIKIIGAEIVEECAHQFQPIGITYIAVITTSHFSIHTWPEYGYAAVDIFSCDDEVPEKIEAKLVEAFGAKRYKSKSFKRDIEGRT